MSTITIKDAAEGAIKATVEDIDLQSTTMDELLSTLYESDTFQRPYPGVEIRAVDKEGHLVRDGEKTLADLGFEDGDTIPFVTLCFG